MKILKCLLLNASYEVLSFITIRKIIRLIIKDKVEIISNWNDKIVWGSGEMPYPAILRLKKHIKRNYINSNFSRKVLIKRDRSQCQYCGKKLSASQITIDHVLPRAQRGITSFTNCVVSCHECNNKKADKTPEQANMVLLKRPTHPSFAEYVHTLDYQEYWHPSWDDFLGNSQ